MKKKILAILLCVVMAIGVLPVYAFAEETTVHTSADGNWNYIILDDGTISITAYENDDPAVTAYLTPKRGYLGRDGAFYAYKDETGRIIDETPTNTRTVLTVPSEIDGYTVSTIGFNAFYLCNALVKIILPDTIREIRSQAFYCCQNLEDVIFCEGVESIGSSAFSECSRLERITFPEGLKQIGSLVFFDCNKLKEVIFPNSVEEFGNKVFFYCWNLDTVNIPTNLTEISDEMFAYSGIRYIEIPSNVKRIGYKAFCNCDNLDNNFVKLSEGLEEIGDKAFYSCKWMNGGLLIPKSVVSMGNEIFTENSRIYVNNHLPYLKGYKNSYAQEYAAEHNFPFFVIDAEEFRFQIKDNGEAELIDYVGLVDEIVVPDTYEGRPVTSIFDGAFDNCPNLKKLTIPATVSEFVGAEENHVHLGGTNRVTVYGYLDTETQRIAEATGYTFIYLDEIISGDLDGDGEISLEDYSFVKDIINGDCEYNNFQFVSADFNGDGSVDAFDLFAIDKTVNNIS